MTILIWVEINYAVVDGNNYKRKNMKFVIGSKSKKKIDICKKVIKQFFDDREFTIESYNAISQVPDTPYDKQTFDGARNRALDSKNDIKYCDYYVGLESGFKVISIKNATFISYHGHKKPGVIIIAKNI